MESQRHVTETERYGEGAKDRDQDPETDDRPGQTGQGWETGSDGALQRKERG